MLGDKMALANEDVSSYYGKYHFRDNPMIIEFYLDNKLVKTDRQLQVRLPSVNRGTHKLKARLISPDGSTLKESVSIFTIHQPSVRN